MHRHKRRHASGLPRMEGRTERAVIHLLGTFEVSVDGMITPARGWTRRTAAALVKILALAPGHRAHREQVMDILWPDESPADAAPKLHKAAYYARRAAGRDDAVVLRNDVVQLFPTADLTVDVVEFDELSRRALADGDPDIAGAAIDQYRGELLPDDRYEEWAGERRELLRLRHVNLLRLAGQWMAVTELDPGDERAHVELMRDQVANGDAGAALLQYERLERVLDRELGVAPGAAARELRDHIATGTGPTLAGRPGRVRLVKETQPSAGTSPCSAVEDLVAELAELTRRQAFLLETLASAAPGCGALATSGAAS
jgi:DNA-binding SARP family transcriptional activator